MELLDTTPWSLVLYAATCFVASFLALHLKDGLFLWLAAGVLVVPAGKYLAKLTTAMALGGYVAATAAGLILFIWVDNRRARRAAKPADDAG